MGPSSGVRPKTPWSQPPHSARPAGGTFVLVGAAAAVRVRAASALRLRPLGGAHVRGVCGRLRRAGRVTIRFRFGGRGGGVIRLLVLVGHESPPRLGASATETVSN